MSYFCRCGVVGVTRGPCILINNVKEAGSGREGLLGKVIRKLNAVVRADEQ